MFIAIVKQMMLFAQCLHAFIVAFVPPFQRAQ